VVCW
jgi:hypothetical protein